MLNRWDRVEVGMTFAQVKRIFGDDMWQNPGLPKHEWLVNNEADASRSHGYVITFDNQNRVKAKGVIFVGD